MAERTAAGLLAVVLDSSPAVGVSLPAEVREKLAELELELSEGKSANEAAAMPPGRQRRDASAKTTALLGKGGLDEKHSLVELI